MSVLLKGELRFSKTATLFLVKRSFAFTFSVYQGFRRGDSELLEGCLFWYNAYSLLFTTFRSCISFCVGDGTEIRDSRAIENTKCQNDKKESGSSFKC